MFFKKSKLPKILVAGSATTDLVFRGKAFEERQEKDRLSLAFGGKYVADEFWQFYGGGGANSSVSLSRQGFDVSLWINVGNDAFGRLIVNNLKREKVSTKLIRFKAKQTPLSAIILGSHGERTIVTYRSDADFLNINNDVQKEFKKRSWFMLISLAQCPKKEKINFLKQAKKENLKTLISLHGQEYQQGYEYLKEYLPYVDILHLNAHELADIYGGEAKDFNFIKTNFAEKLKLPLLVVTYDIHGSFAYTPTNIYYQPITKEKRAVDATGIGDAFCAGFLGKYIKSDSIPQALYFGACNSTSKIEHLGAQNGLLYDK